MSIVYPRFPRSENGKIITIGHEKVKKKAVMFGYSVANLLMDAALNGNVKKDEDALPAY